MPRTSYFIIEQEKIQLCTPLYSIHGTIQYSIKFDTFCNERLGGLVDYNCTTKKYLTCHFDQFNFMAVMNNLTGNFYGNENFANVMVKQKIFCQITIEITIVILIIIVHRSYNIFGILSIHALLKKEIIEGVHVRDIQGVIVLIDASTHRALCRFARQELTFSPPL